MIVDPHHPPYPGRLIAVEGLDGSGKSTQIYLLKRWLEMKGLKVYFTEWNSSLLIKKATSKGKKRQLLTPTTFSLIHCTDFADRYERQILPLLKAGYLVLCDRYIYTAFARDAVRGCSRHLAAQALQLCLPSRPHPLLQYPPAGGAQPHPRRPAAAQVSRSGDGSGALSGPVRKLPAFPGADSRRVSGDEGAFQLH